MRNNDLGAAETGHGDNGGSWQGGFPAFSLGSAAIMRGNEGRDVMTAKAAIVFGMSFWLAGAGAAAAKVGDGALSADPGDKERMFAGFIAACGTEIKPIAEQLRGQVQGASTLSDERVMRPIFDYYATVDADAMNQIVVRLTGKTNLKAEDALDLCFATFRLKYVGK